MYKLSKKMMNRFFEFIATGFYSGRIPWAPGTAGSALALLLYWVIPGFRGIVLGLVVFVFFFIGVAAATVTEKLRGHDASSINIDEMTGLWMALLFLQNLTWGWQLIAFLVFRLMDIVKPFPADESQRLPAGWGVMADDIIAAIYTAVGVRLLFALC